MKNKNNPLTKQKIMAFLATENALESFRAAGWTPRDFCTAGWTPRDFYAVGWTLSDFRAAGWTLSDFRAAGWTLSDFYAAGWTYNDFYATGWTPRDFRAAEWTPSDFYAVGWTLSDFRAAGWTLSDFRAAGWTPSDFRVAGWTLSDFCAAGWTGEAIKEAQEEWDSIPILEKPYTRLLADIQSTKRIHRQSTFGPECDPTTNLCKTPMCTAGHLVNMAGTVGYKLKDKYGWKAAARLIHLKSRPDAPMQNFGDIPQFLAMAYIKERAEEENKN